MAVKLKKVKDQTIVITGEPRAVHTPPCLAFSQPGARHPG